MESIIKWSDEGEEVQPWQRSFCEGRAVSAARVNRAGAEALRARFEAALAREPLPCSRGRAQLARATMWEIVRQIRAESSGDVSNDPPGGALAWVASELDAILAAYEASARAAAALALAPTAAPDARVAALQCEVDALAHEAAEAAARATADDGAAEARAQDAQNVQAAHVETHKKWLQAQIKRAERLLTTLEARA